MAIFLRQDNRRKSTCRDCQSSWANTRQVTLNFLSSYSNIFTIPNTSHPERVIENSQSVDDGSWKLTDKDIEEINRAFPVLDRDSPLEMI